MATIKREFDVVDQVPGDAKEIMREFPRWLEFVPQSARVVILIDGLNRLGFETTLYGAFNSYCRE